jgi:hypothetical protein
VPLVRRRDHVRRAAASQAGQSPEARHANEPSSPLYTGHRVVLLDRSGRRPSRRSRTDRRPAPETSRVDGRCSQLFAGLTYLMWARVDLPGSITSRPERTQSRVPSGEVRHDEAWIPKDLSESRVRQEDLSRASIEVSGELHSLRIIVILTSRARTRFFGPRRACAIFFHRVARAIPPHKIPRTSPLLQFNRRTARLPSPG